MTESGRFYDQQLIGSETANNCKIRGDVLREAPSVVGTLSVGQQLAKHVLNLDLAQISTLRHRKC
jgi:hypothetical protein